jgi:hypothetical protein
MMKKKKSEDLFFLLSLLSWSYLPEYPLKPSDMRASTLYICMGGFLTKLVCGERIPKQYPEGFPLGSQKPQDVDDIDCSIKTLAWEYAQMIQPWHGGFDSVFDALQLSLCNVTLKFDARVSSESQKRRSSRAVVEGVNLYVDPVNGSDENDGSESSPLRTIQVALDNIRASNEGNHNNIILRDTGIHWLLQSISLSPSDSGLSIMAYPGESPTVSGGLELDLEWNTWTPSWLESVDQTFYASLPVGLDPMIVTQLFADDSRFIRARHPNANPETQGLHTPPDTGYFDASSGTWLAHNPEPAASEVCRVFGWGLAFLFFLIYSFAFIHRFILTSQLATVPPTQPIKWDMADRPIDGRAIGAIGQRVSLRAVELPLT